MTRKSGNVVENVDYDKKSESGVLTLNGKRFVFGRRDSARWDERNFRPYREYAVRVARDYNMSDGFYVTGFQLRSLVSRLENHEAVLVKPAV